MPDTHYHRLKTFLEDSGAGHDLAAPLRQGCVVFTTIEGDEQKYELFKKGNKCILRPRQSRKAELYFKFTKRSLDYILDPPPKNAHDLLNRFFDALLETDETKKAHLKILTNLLDVTAKGYLKMLKLGGSRAIPTLAAIGIKIPKFFK